VYQTIYLRFSEVVYFFLLSGAIAAFAYRRAILRHSLFRQLALACSFLYLLVLLNFTLFPLSLTIPPFYRPLSSLLGAALPFTDLYPLLVEHGVVQPWTIVRNIAGNIILFMPLGMLMPLLREVSLPGVVKSAFLISLSIELIQLAVAAIGGTIRIVSSDDIILNVAGAILGFAILWAVRSRLFARTRSSSAHPDTEREHRYQVENPNNQPE